MIGHFNATDLGNKFFHDKNDCEIQDLGNGYLRCKNNTQLLIDRLYINKLIDSDQHQAGEYVLKVASRSGIFPSSVQLNAMPQNNSQPSFSSHKSMKALVLKQITKYFKSSVQQGQLSSFVIDVVCFEKNINKQSDLHLLKLGLNVISNHLYISKSNNSKDCCSHAVQSVVQA